MPGFESYMISDRGRVGAADDAEGYAEVLWRMTMRALDEGTPVVRYEWRREHERIVTHLDRVGVGTVH